MHAEPRISYTALHEIPRFAERVGAPAAARRATCPRRVLNPGGRRLPRGRSLHGTAVADRIPGAWGPWPRRPPGLRASTEVDLDPREDRPALARRQPHRARLRHRVVDRPTPGTTDPAGVRRPAPPEIPQHLAASPGLHPAETPTC